LNEIVKRPALLEGGLAERIVEWAAEAHMPRDIATWWLWWTSHMLCRVAEPFSAFNLGVMHGFRHVSCVSHIDTLWQSPYKRRRTDAEEWQVCQRTERGGGEAENGFGDSRGHSSVRVARRDDFPLPTVEAVSRVPQHALGGTLARLAALTMAVGERLTDGRTAEPDPSDAVSKAEAMALLKLKSERWLRSPKGKQLRCAQRVGGQWMYSRRKIAAFHRGEPIP